MKSIVKKIKRIITGKQWTVFVGGVEVNDDLLRKRDAVELAANYVADGYDEVAVRSY